VRRIFGQHGLLCKAGTRSVSVRQLRGAPSTAPCYGGMMRTSRQSFPNHLNVGIVGATGIVGELIRKVLDQRELPIDTLRLFASARSAGRRIHWKDKELIVEDASTASYSGLNLVFFSAGASTSRKLAPVVAAAGAIVVDNSSAWRSDPEVPLVVSEVNPHALRHVPKRIVANPNCTTMVAMPVLKPLHEAAGLSRMVVSTYQAASGGGGAGIGELESQIRTAATESAKLVYDGQACRFASPKKWAVPLAFNVVPLNYEIVEDGYTEEEIKLRDESRRILEIPGLPVSATCVRVPVYTGHSLSINAQFERDIPVEAALEILRSASGVVVTNVPNPLEATGRDTVFVGRVRRDPTVRHGLVLFVTGDNLRKGAALNAVQIAEELFARPSPRASASAR
jgi:aspartate-semialdehyde dehydrogenase